MSIYKVNEFQNIIEIYFDTPPSAEICDLLKKNSWNWHPDRECWSSYNSVYALEFAQIICAKPLSSTEESSYSETQYGRSSTSKNITAQENTDNAPNVVAKTEKHNSKLIIPNSTGPIAKNKQAELKENLSNSDCPPNKSLFSENTINQETLNKNTSYHLNQGEIEYQFNSSQSLDNTSPVRLLYRSQIVSTSKKWRILFLEFVKHIYSLCPDKMIKIIGKTYPPDTVPLILNKSMSALMRIPIEFAPGLFVELNKSPEGLGRDIALICEICNIKLDDISIVYICDSGDHKQEHKENEFQKSAAVNLPSINNQTNTVPSEKKPIRILWNEYETAMLIETFWQIEKSPDKKNELLVTLSKNLRRMAINAGMEIDEKFRNVNGISLQLSSIAYGFYPERPWISSSAVFDKMIAMYKNDRDSFNAILEAAKKKIGDEPAITDVKKQVPSFKEWLDINNIKKLSHEMMMESLKEADKDLQYRKLIDKSIFDIYDATQVYKLLNKLTSSHFYRLRHMKTVKILDATAPIYKNYLLFLSDYNKAQSSTLNAETDESKIVNQNVLKKRINSRTIGEAVSIVLKESSRPMSAQEIYEAITAKELYIFGAKSPFGAVYSTINQSCQPSNYSHVNPNPLFGSFYDGGVKKYYLLGADSDKSKNEPIANTSASDIAQNSPPISATRADSCSKDFDSKKNIAELNPSKGDQNLERQYKERYPSLYSKLFAVSKVFDDPGGLSLEKICKIIDEHDIYAVQEILSHVSWATEIAVSVYSFAKNISPEPFKLHKEESEKTEESDDYSKDRFIEVLIQRYRNGMMFDSIDFDIFRETYEMLFEEKLTFDDSDLEARLRNCGIMYKDRLFPADGIIDPETRKKLFEYIDGCFASGKTVLYYKAIFADLASELASCYTLADEEMLRAYIEYTAEKGKYYLTEKYLSVEKNVVVDHNAEVADYLLSAGKPMSTDNVCNALSHIPEEQIRHIITTDSRFLRNSKGEYFHEDIFEISEAELEEIAEIINEFIQQNEYAIWTDIWNEIQKKMPEFLENNLYLSGLGIRNALSRRFNGRFNFDGAVISMPKDRYAMRDIYQLYAKHHAEFTANDIYNLSKELDTVIYFEPLAEVSVRVSLNRFVSKDLIQFDVDAVDKAIGSFVSRDYIRIREIDSYLVFPNVGYEWNEYLLENFVYSYSKKFSLLHNGFSLYNVAGAVVKKSGSIQEFVDACAAVLADAPIALNNKDALNYLADVNMITRRSYRDLDMAIKKAMQIRDRKG